MDSLLNLTENFLKLDCKINAKDFSVFANTVRKFLKSGKKDDAFSTYFAFTEIFKFEGESENSIDKLVNFLAEHEFHSGELLSKHRDHYSHSVYVFALGLAYFANTQAFRNIYANYYKLDQKDVANHFLHYWGLVSLFHDIGYPFQLAHEQINNYTGKLWPGDEDDPYVTYKNIAKLTKLSDQVKLDLAEKYPGIADINELFIKALNKIFGFDILLLSRLITNRHDNKDFLDHGYFSALLLANKFSNTNTKFTDEIVDVLVAILVHNSLIPFDLKDEAKIRGTFKQQVDAKQHPLSYLILLMDEIQCWDRQPFGFTSKKDPLAWKTSFEMSDEALKVQYFFDDEFIYHYKETLVSNKLDKDKEFGEMFSYEKIPQQNKRYHELSDKIDGLSKFDKTILSKIVPLTPMVFTAEVEPKVKSTEKYASDDKLFNLVAFAKAINYNYQMIFRKKEKERKTFNELSLEAKMSNIEQAKSYAYKLELINCLYSDKELDYPVVEEFGIGDENKTYSGTRNDLSYLAREEHIRWVKEKLENGWKYGVEGKDYTAADRDEKKRHKDIIPYDFLTKEEKDKDELMIANMIPLLYTQGNGIRIYSYRQGRKKFLEIAAFGHTVFANKENELRQQIREYFQQFTRDYKVIFRSTFRPGSELIMAEEAIKLGIIIKAAIPFNSIDEYVEHLKVESKELNYKFDEKEEYRLRHLLALCVTIKCFRNEQFTYLDARKYILDQCDKLLCLYDRTVLPLFDLEGKPIHKGTVYDIVNTANCSDNWKQEDIKIIVCERKGKAEI